MCKPRKSVNINEKNEIRARSMQHLSAKWQLFRFEYMKISQQGIEMPAPNHVHAFIYKHLLSTEISHPRNAYMELVHLKCNL